MVKREPTSLAGLLKKTGARVEAEQAVLRVLETGKASLWTLPQLRHALRQARQRLIVKWAGTFYATDDPDDGRALLARRVGRLWYAAVVAVAGCPVRKLTDRWQVEISDWRRR